MLGTTSFNILQEFKKKRKKSLVGLELHNTLNHQGSVLPPKTTSLGSTFRCGNRTHRHLSCGSSLFASRVFLITASGLGTVSRIEIMSLAGKGEPGQLVASHAGDQHVGIQCVANAVKIWSVAV